MCDACTEVFSDTSTHVVHQVSQGGLKERREIGLLQLIVISILAYYV